MFDKFFSLIRIVLYSSIFIVIVKLAFSYISIVASHKSSSVELHTRYAPCSAETIWQKHFHYRGKKLYRNNHTYVEKKKESNLNPPWKSTWYFMKSWKAKPHGHGFCKHEFILCWKLENQITSIHNNYIREYDFLFMKQFSDKPHPQLGPKRISNDKYSVQCSHIWEKWLQIFWISL